MGDEREFKIKITTSADASGAREAKAELDSLSPKTQKYIQDLKDGKGAADGMHVSHRGMSHALRLLGPEVTHLGMNLMHAFGSPPMLAIMGVAAALKGLDMAMKSASERDTRELGITSLAPKMAHFEMGIVAARAALLEYFDTIGAGGTAQERLGSATERATVLMKAQEEAAKGGDDAEKELALAQLDRAKALGMTEAEAATRKDVIENEFDKRQVKREKDAREGRLAAEWKEQGALEKLGDLARIKGLAGNSEGSTRDEQANAERISAAIENQARFNKQPHLTAAEAAARDSNQAVLDLAIEKQPGLKAKADEDRKALQEAESSRIKAREMRDKLVAESQAADTLNAGGTSALRMRSQTRQTRAETEILNSPEGKLFNDVAGAETILRQGGHISVRQASEIRVAAQLMNQAHVEGGQAMLSALQVNTRQVIELARKIQALEKQQRGLASPP